MFRLRNTKDKRLRSVLEAVAEGYEWEPQSAPSGRGLGVACGIDAGTYVAHIVEVVVDRTTGKVQVKRVVCAQDMGLVVNPEVPGCRWKVASPWGWVTPSART